MWQDGHISKRLGFGFSLVDKSRANDIVITHKRCRGEKNILKKDTWLLKGIVPTPFFYPCRFLYNSLNLLRLQSESKIPLGVLGPSLLYALKLPPNPMRDI